MERLGVVGTKVGLSEQHTRHGSEWLSFSQRCLIERELWVFSGQRPRVFVVIELSADQVATLESRALMLVDKRLESQFVLFARRSQGLHPGLKHGVRL